MANYKGRNRSTKNPKLPKFQQPHQKQNEPQKRHFLTAARIAYTGLFAVVSWIATVMIFIPKINISPTETFDPPSPFSARFEIQNNGNFPVYDVHLSARANGRVGGMVFGKGENNEYPDSEELFPGLKPSDISKIDTGQKPATWMTFEFVNCPTKRGDRLVVEITARFRPSFAWWHKIIKQRFTTVRSQTGSFGWVEVPSDSN